MNKSRLSRRAFSAVVAGAGAATTLNAKQKATKEITQASVPGDPAAPAPQTGTLPEVTPFAGELVFTRRIVAPRVNPFRRTEVQLLPSAFKDAQEANRAVLNDLPADRLLHSFRVNAGLPSSSQPLGGWEKLDCELRGHFAGHFLSGCALMYSSTGDKELKAKGDYMVAELAKCQQRLGGGYLSAFPLELFDRLKARKEVWAPFYTVHKIMAGMLDMYQECDNHQALDVLKGMAGWTDTWTASMPEEHMQSVLDTEYGGMNEVLYNLAAVTGDDRFAAVGDRFTKKRFFNPLALRRDELRGLHTNTHIPQVIGAARRYELSGDQRFHDVADYFWHEVTGTRTYVTGGTSNNEGWLVEPNRLAAELSRGTSTNECCCAYNMLKLTRSLYTWTADPRYFDYYERTLYNHRLGTINTRTGATQYYLSIVPGAWRTFNSRYDSFWCCTGTGVEEYSKLNDSIYFHDEDGIYVNLFIPSEVKWAQKNLRIRQETSFPQMASTRLLIDADEPIRTAIHIRIPAWASSAPTVKINGRASEISASPGSYLTVVSTWKTGDSIELDLPMHLYIESMPDDRAMQAILYGPLVLAGELGGTDLTPELVIGHMGPDLKKHPADGVPSLRVSDSAIESAVKPGDRGLTFRTVGQKADVSLVPFHTISGQRYAVYWNVS